MDRPSWDEYFMGFAKLAATRSTCLRRNVGAAIVRDHQLLATGYNGAPTGQAHCLDIGCIRQAANIPSGEKHEIGVGVHAEQNVICQAAKHGIAINGATLYCTHQPCSICAKMIVNAGIEMVYYNDGYPDVETLNILKGRIKKI